MSESQAIEYKNSWHDDYLKWVCGFANAQGGKIYIGKDDAENVIGVADYKDLMKKPIPILFFVGMNRVETLDNSVKKTEFFCKSH
jgi:predicted HTH transcriptional regulator